MLFQTVAFVAVIFLHQSHISSTLLHIFIQNVAFSSKRFGFSSLLKAACCLSGSSLICNATNAKHNVWAEARPSQKLCAFVMNQCRARVDFFLIQFYALPRLGINLTLSFESLARFVVMRCGAVRIDTDTDKQMMLATRPQIEL